MWMEKSCDCSLDGLVTMPTGDEKDKRKAPEQEKGTGGTVCSRSHRRGPDRPAGWAAGRDWNLRPSDSCRPRRENLTGPNWSHSHCRLRTHTHTHSTQGPNCECVCSVYDVFRRGASVHVQTRVFAGRPSVWLPVPLKMLLDKELFMLKPGFLLTPKPDMLGR